jgi:hypothetical protein
VTRRKHTLVLGHYRDVGQSIRGKGDASVTRREHNNSAYGSHSNETHVTEKTHSNAVQLKFLRIQTEDPS